MSRQTVASMRHFPECHQRGGLAMDILRACALIAVFFFAMCIASQKVEGDEYLGAGAQVPAAQAELKAYCRTLSPTFCRGAIGGACCVGNEQELIEEAVNEVLEKTQQP